MMKHIIPAFAAIIILASCGKPAGNQLTRIVYDPHGLTLITSSVNKHLQTMSALYGNKEAYAAALAGDGHHVAGESFAFVTWQYHDDPVYYGSSINGELLSVETIHVESDTTYNYQLEKGNAQPVNGTVLNTAQRINYIFGYKPSVMP
ncbi:hypothetical protein [Deminuibacter soli]|uniref:Uncharacterized protein n=1 Tax=Deminuibacter soli TaxID=2291815 RepID=A0A3E1NKR3_9BACT|nr:hypothetical protein [Deminuibacter soli]RFM28529.1 hypothetical protein DXN05_06905 [Deminuibacter soli]